MKMQSAILFDPISKTTLQSLVTPVTETLAKEMNNSRNKIFSSADLWRIQRRSKTTLVT